MTLREGREREGRREGKQTKKSKHVSHLCRLKGPRSYDAQVAKTIPSMQIGADTGKEHEPGMCYCVRGTVLKKKKKKPKSQVKGTPTAQI